MIPRHPFSRNIALSGTSGRLLAAAVQGVNGEGAAEDYLGHARVGRLEVPARISVGHGRQDGLGRGFRPTDRNAKHGCSIAGPAICVVLLAAVGVARWIVGPIDALKEFDPQAGGGRFLLERRESRIAEVTDLARAFNTMAESGRGTHVRT